MSGFNAHLERLGLLVRRFLVNPCHFSITTKNQALVKRLISTVSGALSGASYLLTMKQYE